MYLFHVDVLQFIPFFEGTMETRNPPLNRTAVQMVILTSVRDDRRIARICDTKTRDAGKSQS